MKLNSLEISRERWGDNKGQLKAKISIEGKSADVTMDLPSDVGDKIIMLARSVIIDAVEESANDFIFEITTAIPESLSLEHKSKINDPQSPENSKR